VLVGRWVQGHLLRSPGKEGGGGLGDCTGQTNRREMEVSPIGRSKGGHLEVETEKNWHALLGQTKVPTVREPLKEKWLSDPEPRTLSCQGLLLWERGIKILSCR